MSWTWSKLHMSSHRHHPRKRMIQYAAAVPFDLRRRGVLDNPHAEYDGHLTPR